MRKITTFHVPTIDAGKARTERQRQPAVTLSEQAYETIKNWIITCKFVPGEIIDEVSVAALIGLGRTPVHHALSRLNLEGLVDVIPRKGVIVTPIVPSLVMQLAETRLICETQCAGLAAERADATDVKKLREILKAAQAAIRKRDVETMMLKDREFHLTLARASRNEYLTNIIGNLSEHSLRFWFISFTTDHHPRFQRQHEDIVEAVAAHSSDRAQAAMRKHLEMFRQNVERQFEDGRPGALAPGRISITA